MKLQRESWLGYNYWMWWIGNHFGIVCLDRRCTVIHTMCGYIMGIFNGQFYCKNMLFWCVWKWRMPPTIPKKGKRTNQWILEYLNVRPTQLKVKSTNLFIYILCILYILYVYIYIHISSWAEIYVFGFFLCSIWMWKNRAKLLVVTYIDVHPSQYGIIRCHAYINSMSRLHLTLFKLNCWRLNTHLHPIFHV